MKRQNPENNNNIPSAKRRHKATRPTSTKSNSQSESSRATSSNKNGKSKKQKVSFLSLSEMASLIEIFYHLQSQGIHNRTLDQMIYESFCHLYHQLATNKKEQPLPAQIQKSLISMLYPTKRYKCVSYWPQIRQLKAQLHGFRYLSRDLPITQTIIDLMHGDNNPHSKQRFFIDPTIVSKENEKSKLNKFDLQYKKQWLQDNLAMNNNNSNSNNDDLSLIIDNTPQTIESMVYQSEYNGMSKLLDRRAMLSKYIKTVENCDEIVNSTQFLNNVQELERLKLIELQRSMKHTLLEYNLFTKCYQCDDTETEPLLNPLGFQRTAKIGLQFEQHINDKNHPPAAIQNVKQPYPFHFKGEA